jgi:hypothetical protein
MCEGTGAIKIFHVQKICLNCNEKTDTAKHWNKSVKHTYTFSECKSCKSLSLTTSMKTVMMDCPLCQGTGSINWIDIMIRPYKKANIERKILDMVINNGNSMLQL